MLLGLPGTVVTLYQLLRSRRARRSLYGNSEAFSDMRGGGGIDMRFRMIHENFNVSDLDASLAFYEKAWAVLSS